MESATESASNLVRRNSPKGLSSLQASATTTAASAATMTKIARQPTVSTSTPESDGPMVGAKPMMRPMTPMAEPRRSRGMTSRMTLNTIGMTKPVALACMTRPSSSSENTGAHAATTEPAQNSAMPPMNRRRVENRPIRYAASGMTTASVSAYPEVSHCTVVEPTLRSAMMVGSAGVSSVALSTAMNVPVSSTATIFIWFLVIPRPIEPSS